METEAGSPSEEEANMFAKVVPTNMRSEPEEWTHGPGRIRYPTVVKEELWRDASQSIL